jgi:hypothetical protein
VHWDAYACAPWLSAIDGFVTNRLLAAEVLRLCFELLPRMASRGYIDVINIIHRMLNSVHYLYVYKLCIFDQLVQNVYIR